MPPHDNPLVGVSPQSHSEGFCVGVQASAGVKSQAGIYSQKACKHKSIETLIIRAKKKNKQSRCSSAGQCLNKLWCIFNLESNLAIKKPTLMDL